MSVYECPSGLTLELRGLRGKELRILEDKTSKKTNRTYDSILTSCTVKVVNVGPYKDLDQGQDIDWDKMLVGDKFFALLAIRAETFGSSYDFNFKCTSCGEMVPWTIDVLKHLEIKKLAPDDARKFRQGETFDAVLANGDTVKYRLPVGADEHAASVSKNTGDALLVNLARRLSGVVTAEGESKAPKAYLEEAGLKDVLALAKELQSHDCGVNTTIEVQCNKLDKKTNDLVGCEAVQELQLPLGRAFWAPTA